LIVLRYLVIDHIFADRLLSASITALVVCLDYCQAGKNQKPNKWNPFLRGAKSKSGAKLSVLNDPAESVEWQRVSFATSIDNLPERPSAFKQVCWFLL